MAPPTLDRPEDLLRRWYDDSVRAVEDSFAALDPVVQAWSDALAALPSLGAGSWDDAPPGRRGGRRRGKRRHGHDHDHGHGDCGCGGKRRGNDGHRHRHGHGHSACGCDSCHCCVTDADLVVVSRLGERRIVPLVLHNERRRERKVTVGVGEFRDCEPGTDDVLVRAVARPGGELTLPPCSTTSVEILVASGPMPRSAGNDDAASAGPAAADASLLAAAEHPGRIDTDGNQTGGDRLDRCVTQYANVTVDGCARPIRLAVVLLPNDCDAYDVRCDCGCCGC
jgi:hypothetical protein